jgi:hypothetical protein
VVTMAFNVPLNNALAAADPASAEATSVWARYLKDWTLWNHVRGIAPPAASAPPSSPDSAENGAPGRTRTCNRPLRRRMLYPVELRALVLSGDGTARPAPAGGARQERASYRRPSRRAQAPSVQRGQELQLGLQDQRQADHDFDDPQDVDAGHPGPSRPDAGREPQGQRAGQGPEHGAGRDPAQQRLAAHRQALRIGRRTGGPLVVRVNAIAMENPRPARAEPAMAVKAIQKPLTTTASIA